MFYKPQASPQFLLNPTGEFVNNPQYQAGGDVNVAQGKSAIATGTSVAAAGNISGTLNLNLNTLRETEDPKNKELADLIDQLKQAIEAPDSELDDRHKKRAIEYLNKLAELAKANHCQGIICGHIHKPDIRQIGDITYMNSGDWVESLSALVEDHHGNWELLYFLENDNLDLYDDDLEEPDNEAFTNARSIYMSVA